MDCLFCKMNEGAIPSYVVYEDEVVRVVLDAFPDTNGHLLIVPKEHTENLDTISDDTLFHVMKIAKKMKLKLEDVMGCDGVTLIVNNGLAQEIKHFHLHLKPCYKANAEKMEVADVYQIFQNNQ